MYTGPVIVMGLLKQQEQKIGNVYNIWIYNELNMNDDSNSFNYIKLKFT